MTWTKLDDDAVFPDQPLSAFVGNRISLNAQSYKDELGRLSTFVYPTTSAGAARVKWASILGRRGMVYTVNLGIKSWAYVIKVFCRTTNASLGGTIYVRDLDSGNTISQTVPGSATPITVSIPYYINGGASGLRGFHISFESDIGDVVGSVEVNGAVGNQVFCEPATGTPYPFTLATGYYEMYHLLRLSTTGELPAPAGDGLREYQVCAFRHNTNANTPPEGVLVVWPNVEVNPPILSTETGATGIKTTVPGELLELGRIELYSIAVEAIAAPGLYFQPPTAYQQTTSIARVNNLIDSALDQLQPDACTLLSSDGFLGCVLPAGTEATFAFFVQYKQSTLNLNVSFRAVAYNQTQNAPDITFGVRDYIGNSVGTDVTLTSVPVPRVTGQTTVEPREGAAVYMNGVLAGAGNWGMRDAMDVDQAMTGLPVRMSWGPNTAGDINWGQVDTADAVYYGHLSATSDLYIYGFNCRVL